MSTSTDRPIGLTGNPFVDTGLAVLASLSDLDHVERLTLQDMQRVHDDGRRLSSWNGSLKSFTMVFTKNSLLTNASIKDQHTRTEMYQSVVNGLLDRIGHEELPFRCEACGGKRTLDFDRLCRSALAETTTKDQARFIGRDWFPLAGSMGSDAQALPSASRPVHLCAKCLFAVHYLPLGLILLDGRLAAFQSTSVEFWYELVRDIVLEREVRNQAGDYSNIGVKEGSRGLVERLLKLFKRLQEAKRLSEIPPAAALEAWRFTNSNPPDCDVVEIPNPALRFLWEAAGLDLRAEIADLIKREGKRERSFLQCILDHRDYGGLYPAGNSAGASPRLFALYQTRVCSRSARMLQLAHLLANERASELSEKDLDRLKRREALFDSAARTPFRGMMVDLASEGKFTLDDYLALFPMSDDEPGIRVEFQGWNIIRYYLHHLDGFESIAGQLPPSPKVSAKSAAICYYGARIMQGYVDERGRDRFNADVVSRTARGEIGVAWLQQWFVRLAEVYPGFTYGAWRDIYADRNGRAFVAELLFQMRLLWVNWLGQGTIPEAAVPYFQDNSVLSDEIVLRLKYAFSLYVHTRGLARFQRDILTRLRRKEIGLQWLRRTLCNELNASAELRPLSELALEVLLRDQEGRPNSRERLFQIQLMLANFFREACNTTKEVTA